MKIKAKTFYSLCVSVFLSFSVGCAVNKRIYSVHPAYEKVYFVKTEDDWSLALYHYPPRAMPNGKPPVILCHGLNQNYLNWDLTPKWSLARALSAKGYDVWAVSLRGSGKSTKPGWGQFLELNQFPSEIWNRERYDYRKFNWNIDDYILKDIPALLRYVQQKTGRLEVTWVGHSMGGMVALAHLGLNPLSPIKNLVLIGVPGEINHPKTELQQMIVNQETLLRMSLLINTKNLTTMSAPISDKLNGPLQILSYNAANMSREILTRFNAQVIENTSTGVVSQMKMIVKNGYFCSADEKVNYSDNFENIRAHLLCLAGKLDNMAPPGSVLSIYHRFQSPDKMYRLFGLANGYSNDYGHNDLILGKKAPEEVYPYILAWLNQH